MTSGLRSQVCGIRRGRGSTGVLRLPVPRSHQGGCGVGRMVVIPGTTVEGFGSLRLLLVAVVRWAVVVGVEVAFYGELVNSKNGIWVR